MLNLLVQRLLGGLVTLLAVISLTFILIRLLPGGPFQDPKVPPAIQAQLEAKYHLNEPMWVQYGYYLKDLLHGDLGPSLVSESRSVNEMVKAATGASVAIGVPALVLGTLAGVILGTGAGLTRRCWVDHSLSLLGLASLSIPAFIFGGLLVLVFSLTLGWLPAATLQSPAHYVLPVMTLSLVPFAYAFLLVRTSVKETQGQLFVLIKKSFGLPEKTIALRHVLRNSLMPLLSIMGPLAAALITGSFAVEYLFAVPGLGKYFVNAVSNRDYTLVMGITLVFSVVLIVFNTLTDLLYGLLDPRLREASER